LIFDRNHYFVTGKNQSLRCIIKLFIGHCTFAFYFLRPTNNSQVKYEENSKHKFVGALQGQRAKRGIFITTGRFSREATDYASAIDTKVVLVEGDKLPTADSYDYAVEFRHPSWGTEDQWEMLKHYNIAAAMTDSPAQENLQFLSDVIVTANQSFIRFHGRNSKDHYWYNYLYSEQELKPRIEKVDQLREETKILRIYFNNHYGGKAVINAMQFKDMNEMSLSIDERRVLERAKTYIA
jgi:hypothetical protein